MGMSLDGIFSIVQQFALNHEAVTAILISAMWWMCGTQELRRNRRDAGKGWQGIALLVLAAFTIRFIYKQYWNEMALVLCAFGVEVFLLSKRHTYVEETMDSVSEDESLQKTIDPK